MTYGPSLIFVPHVLLITIIAFLLSLISDVLLLMPVIVRPSAGDIGKKIHTLLSRSSESASFCVAEGSAHLSPACEPRAHSRKQPRASASTVVLFGSGSSMTRKGWWLAGQLGQCWLE